jgi:hypothetical protein
VRVSRRRLLVGELESDTDDQKDDALRAQLRSSIGKIDFLEGQVGGSPFSSLSPSLLGR